MIFILFVTILSVFSIFAFTKTYSELWELAAQEYYEMAPCPKNNIVPDISDTERAVQYYEKVFNDRNYLAKTLKSDDWYTYDTLYMFAVKDDQLSYDVFDSSFVVRPASGGFLILDTDHFFKTLSSYLIPKDEKWNNQRIYIENIPGLSSYSIVISILDVKSLQRLYDFKVPSFIGMVFGLVVLLSMFFVQAMRSFVFDPVNNLSSQIKNNRYDDPNDVIVLETRSELSQIADAFNHVKGIMLESDKKRKSFVEDVSHAIKTPMMTIKLIVDRYLDYPNDLSDEILGSLENIRDLIKREEKALNQLVYISKLDTKEVSESGIVDLTAVVKNVISNVNVVFDLKDVDLKYESPYSISVISRDEEMSVLIENLLDNAYKHTEQGDSVTVRLEPFGNDKCVLEVADTGDGIDEKDLPLIFDRFHHRDKDGSDKGIGLGLSICKAIVEDMNGTIEVKSQVGQGTSFIITMPMYSLGI